MIKQEIQHRKRFWEQQHLRNYKPTLSGCTYGDTIRFLQLSPYITQDARVLEVGVGLGYVTQELKMVTAGVWALDITEEALRKVSPYTRRGYLLENIVELPTDFFDVIICHNLIQHVKTDVLREELSHLIRSLKPETGVFAIEFVSGNVHEDTGAWGKDEYSAGNYLRSVRFMTSLVEELGGQSTLVVSNSCLIGEVTGCHLLHIRKKNDEIED